MGEKICTFETNDEIVSYSLDLGYNDNKCAFAYGERLTYFLLHQNYLSIDDKKNSTEKSENQYMYEKR